MNVLERALYTGIICGLAFVIVMAFAITASRK